MINVTRSFLPPIEDYYDLLKSIWSRNWLTNNGPLVISLENCLKDYLKIPHLLYVNNGTIALQIAIRMLGLKDEIITTPFSYIATTSSIVWEGAVPVFVDIDARSLNIDPLQIEDAITERTTAILATHVYGNPCDVKMIDQIAKKYDLKVIYDGAHAFGTSIGGRSIFEYGDITATSFHATKLFHTIEGGAVICNDASLRKDAEYMRNFGQETNESFACIGINGKNSEFHAAMGLLNLHYVDEILASRKRCSHYYNRKLEELKAEKIEVHPEADYNHAYYPIIFPHEKALLKAMEALNAQSIFPRRYFKSSLNELKYVIRQQAPVSEDIAKRVLCLPLYYDITYDQMDIICDTLLEVERKKNVSFS